jgi:hypothetical protein
MTTGRPAGYSAISSYSRVEILHLVQEQPNARSPNRLVDEAPPEHGARASAALIDDGYVVSATEHRTTRGRPRVLYSAADGVNACSPVQRRKVKAAAARGDLLRRVSPRGTRARHGGAPSDRRARRGPRERRLRSVVDERELTVELTPCQHASAQASHRKVLCSVHLGIMQSVLSSADGPSVDGMRSSCDPRECIVQLMHASQRP